MGQDTEEREPERSKYNILNKIYICLLTPKIHILRVIFANIKFIAASKS